MSTAHASAVRPPQGATSPAYFDDFAVGMTFRSPVRVLAEDDVRAYVRFSNDVRPIFGAGSATALRVPQMYLFSLGVAMLLHGDPGYIPEHFVAFYGFDSIEFHSPAVTGTAIASVAIVTAVESRNATGIVHYRHETRMDNGLLLASSSQRILVLRRPQHA